MNILVNFLLCLVFPLSRVGGHVKLFFSDDTVDLKSRPIRNAPSSDSDGTMSTDGPCGVADDTILWGNNGFSTAEVGEDIYIKINYNGGHKSTANFFSGVFSCDGEVAQSSLEAASTESQISVDCAAVRCPVSGEYPCGAPDGNDFTDGYVFNCTIPVEAEGDRCTLAIIDQRDWGGCYDMLIQNVTDTPSPTAAPAEGGTPLTQTSTYAGVYLASTDSVVSNTPDNVTCCELDFGKFYVSDTSSGGVQILSDLIGSCLNASFVHYSTQDMSQDALGTIWRSSINIGTAGLEQLFEISLSETDGVMQLTQMDPEQPVFCDLVIEQRDQISTDDSFFDSDEVIGGTVGIALLAIVFFCGVCFYHFYCSRANEASKMTTSSV